jgi:hypothetical protein
MPVPLKEDGSPCMDDECLGLHEKLEAEAETREKEELDRLYQTPDTWCMVVIILFAIIAGAQVVRCIQNRNRLHLIPFASAGLVISAYVLELKNIIDATFILIISGWFMLLLLTRLVVKWLSAVTSHTQTEGPSTVGGLKKCRVIFSFTKLIEIIYYILCFSLEWSEIYKFTWLRAAAFFVEIFLVGDMAYICSRCILPLWKATNPEHKLKRRQLYCITSMLIAQVVYMVCLVAGPKPWSFFTGEASEYIAIVLLVACYGLTLFPRDAITGLGRIPHELIPLPDMSADPHPPDVTGRCSSSTGDVLEFDAQEE